MGRIVLLLGAFLIVFSIEANCQSRKEKRKAQKGQQAVPAVEAGENGAPNSLNPNNHGTEYIPKRSKKSSSKVTYNLEQEYYDRVEAVARQRQKTAKIMEKPQYSNPMYFGHKKMPKKRSPKRMRFCKECGIRH